MSSLTFEATATIAKGATGALPGSARDLVLGLHDNLTLTVAGAVSPPLKSLTGGGFVDLMGGLTSVKFFAMMTDGTNEVQLKLNGGNEILYIKGSFQMQADPDNPITAIEAASDGATIEYLIIE